LDGHVLLDSFLALVAFFWVVLPAAIFAMAVLVSRRAPAPARVQTPPRSSQAGDAACSD
jgi:hypothetical protein